MIGEGDNRGLRVGAFQQQTAFAVLFRLDGGDLARRRLARNGGQVFIGQREDLRRLHIAGNHQHGVVGRVIGFEKLLQIGLGPAFDIRRVANGRELIRVRGKCGGLHLFDQRTERLVVHAGTALAIHHAALAFDHLVIKRQMRNTVGFQIKNSVQRAAGEPVGVHRAVIAGAGVVAAAGGFHDAVKFAGCAPTGAVEHHVFEKMCQPGDAGVFVAAADLVEGIKIGIGNVMVWPDDDLQAIGQRFTDDGFAAWHLGRSGCGGRNSREASDAKRKCAGKGQGAHRNIQ